MFANCYDYCTHTYVHIRKRGCGYLYTNIRNSISEFLNKHTFNMKRAHYKRSKRVAYAWANIRILNAFASPSFVRRLMCVEKIKSSCSLTQVGENNFERNAARSHDSYYFSVNTHTQHIRECVSLYTDKRIVSVFCASLQSVFFLSFHCSSISSLKEIVHFVGFMMRLILISFSEEEEE